MEKSEERTCHRLSSTVMTGKQLRITSYKKQLSFVGLNYRKQLSKTQSQFVFKKTPMNEGIRKKS